MSARSYAFYYHVSALIIYDMRVKTSMINMGFSTKQSTNFLASISLKKKKGKNTFIGIKVHGKYIVLKKCPRQD